MKKLFNLMLIAVLTLVSFIPSVSAVTNDYANDGSITVTGTSNGKTYDIYQVLILDSYADIDGTDGMGENDGYIYKVPANTAAADWYDFVTTTSYLTVDAQGYVTWNTGDEAQFAKDALAYAEENGIAPTATLTGNGGEITFTGLNYGYYLVDSSVGALCGLSTTSPTATVNEKNSDPTVNKQVAEKGEFGSSNSAFIGETVDFKTTINVGNGAQDYVLYDKMSDGLEFVENSIVVKAGTTTLEEGSDKDYTVAYNVEKTIENEDGEEETVTYTFVITFLADLAEENDVVVTYSAVVDTDAVVGTEGNTNTATLEYGDSHSLESTTTTYTYSFDLVKTDNNDKLLTGAEFELYEQDGENLGTRIYVEKISDGLYRVTQTANTVVIEAGKVTIEGLDTGNYYLKETRNPDGYTKLLDYEAVVIGSANNPATMNQAGDEYVEGGVQVINTKGNLLPSTGGIGTTLFIVIGSLMVTLFGVLLVTKARMSKMDI